MPLGNEFIRFSILSRPITSCGGLFKEHTRVVLCSVALTVITCSRVFILF